jgi:hypothetical protein
MMGLLPAEPAASGRAPVSEEAISALRRDFRFRLAMLSSARSSIALHSGGGLAGWVLGDRARALFGYFALYLDATRDPEDPRSGLTPTRMKDVATQWRICSRGRAGAMLALMRAAGYVLPASAPGDGRVSRLVPTKKLLDLHRRRLQGQFEAMGDLLPGVQPALKHLHDQAFQYGLVLGLADYFTAGFRMLDHTPELKLFAERTAGMVILFSLRLNELEPSPESSASASIAGLSRRFRVSRTHILRLLRDAERQELLSRIPGSEGIALAQRARDALERFFAVMFLYFAAGARTALASPAPHLL